MTDDDAPEIIVSYSELSTFRQCPLKHHLAYQRRWRKPTPEDSALTRGTLWHTVLEEHYKTISQSKYAGKKRTEAQDKRILAVAWERIIPHLFDENGAQTPNQELITWMYQGYVEKYGTDQRWKIIATEHQILVPLLDENGNVSRYVLKVKIDLIVMDLQHGFIWIIDHKSCGDLPKQFDLDLDDQFGLYQWAVQRVGRLVQGTIHSAARTTRNKGDHPDAGKNTKAQTLEQRFARTPMARTDVELNNLALDAYNATAAAYPPEGITRSLYSSPNPRSCGWQCDMRTAHLMMRQGRAADDAMTETGFVIDLTRH